MGRKKRVAEWMSMDAFWKMNAAHYYTKCSTFAVFAVAELDRPSREDLAKSANPCQIHENSHPSAAPSLSNGMLVYCAPVDTGGVKALAVRV